MRYDEPLDEALFAYVPGSDEQPHLAASISEPFTLADAIARMPFVVLSPTRLSQAELAEARLMYRPPRTPSGKAELITVFPGSPSLMIIQQSAVASREAAELEWEPCVRDGIEMAISEPARDDGMRIVSLERHGTHVWITSKLDREPLIDLAASLAPAKASRRNE